VPHGSQHRVAPELLPRLHQRPLPAAPDPAVPAVPGDRAPPGGRAPRVRGRRVRRQRARAPPGRRHARHRRRVLLRLPAALPDLHGLGHPGVAEERPLHRHGQLLYPPLLLPYHALPQLRSQPYPLQPHVLQVPRWLHETVRHAASERRVLSPAGGLRPEQHLKYDDAVVIVVGVEAGRRQRWDHGHTLGLHK